jgi:hypothetical protein
MGTITPPRDRRAPRTIARLVDEKGRERVVTSKTVPRWQQVLRWSGGLVALGIFLWGGLPYILQEPFRKAVADLAAPHEEKAAMDHARLEGMIRANELEHERFVQRLDQDERQWAASMKWYSGDSAEKERQLLDIQQGMRRLLELQSQRTMGNWTPNKGSMR